MRTAPCTRPSTRSGTVASQRLAAFAVDSYDQTPAVVRVRAVRHHRVVFHPARRDGGPDVPAPRGALAQGPRIVVRAAHGPGGASSCLPRSASRWRMTPVGEHVTHIHRWVPALVLPFRFIAAPHTGHLFALLDFVLMASSPPPELPYFSARKNDTPTRLLPQDQTRNISNTFVPIARFHRGA